MKDDTELFKQFMDNQSFKRWLTDTVFGLAYEQVDCGVRCFLIFTDYNLNPGDGIPSAATNFLPHEPRTPNPVEKHCSRSCKS